MSTRAPSPFRRSGYGVLRSRLEEPRRFLQVLAGPRQVGKTTLARQVLATLSVPGHFATCDEPALRERGWIQAQWDLARTALRSPRRVPRAVLILDEVQKIEGWSETVKRLWDEDAAAARGLHVVLLGSSPLLVQRGMRESLAGRFEMIPMTHWSYTEMREAFGWTLDRYIFFGGYPGAVPLTGDHARWVQYVSESMVEPSISRDILLMTRVDKPALLRQVFQLACDYSGEVLSYQKMLGQLRDAGNTVTVAHYFQLLSGAGLVAGLSKYAGSRLRLRGSSPKLQALNTGLMSASGNATFTEVRSQPDRWGRIVESAVGAHLANAARLESFELFYWREGSHEVDFVIKKGKTVVAIEVKSGRARPGYSGLAAFSKAHRPHQALVVGGGGIPIEEFLGQSMERWLT